MAVNKHVLADTQNFVEFYKRLDFWVMIWKLQWRAKVAENHIPPNREMATIPNL